MDTSRELVERSNATARHFLGAGRDMDLKPAGQILPNELDTRVNGGVDTSLDLSTVKERQETTFKMFGKVFGQSGLEKEYRPRFEAETYLGDSVASHEYGHAIGLHPTTESRLGNDLVGPYVEEWKASVGGLVFNTWLPFKNGEGDTETLRTALLHYIATSARYSANRGHDTAKAYYRQSMMLMATAEDAGVVRHSEDNETPWELDLSDAAVKTFFEAVTSQYHDLLTIYAEGSREDLKGFISKNVRASDFVNYMATAVEDPSSGKALPSPAQIAALPS
jgi:hypothetical protein